MVATMPTVRLGRVGSSPLKFRRHPVSPPFTLHHGFDFFELSPPMLRGRDDTSRLSRSKPFHRARLISRRQVMEQFPAAQSGTPSAVGARGGRTRQL